MSRTEAFDAFTAGALPRLRRTAYLLTYDRHLADDLVQTALAKVWRRWEHIDGVPEAYARRVMVNTFSDWRGRRWNGETPTEVLPETALHEPDRDMAREVRAAVLSLPRRQRAVLVLRYFDDLSEAETADVLGCSIGTVKSQAHRALAKLRIDESLNEARGEGGVGR